MQAEHKTLISGRDQGLIAADVAHIWRYNFQDCIDANLLRKLYSNIRMVFVVGERCAVEDKPAPGPRLQDAVLLDQEVALLHH